MTAEVELDGMLRRLHMPTVRRPWSDLQVRAEEEKMRYADYLQVLVGEEIAHRTQTRISRMTHRARFPFLRTIKEFDFAFQSGLRKELLGSYLGPEFVPEGRNLLLYGPSGTGKAHVAIAIAYKAIQHGSDARFVTAAHLSTSSPRRAVTGGYGRPWCRTRIPGCWWSTSGASRAVVGVSADRPGCLGTSCLRPGAPD